MYFTYICKNNHKFQVSKGLRESVVLIACPTCGTTDTRRKFQAPTVKYKGKGFYSTDNPK